MVKSQKDFTFEEAKDATLYDFSILIHFMEKLRYQMPKYVSQEWITRLIALKDKISNSSNRCLSTAEILQLEELAQQLILFVPDISLQLSEFWYLFSDVLKCLKENPNTPPYALQSHIVRMKAEIDEADSLAERVVDEVHTNPSSAASALALLQVHVNRSEKIEYSMALQINDAISTFNLEGYDTKFMCSVQRKVRNNKEADGYRTDVRAIRDAASHFKYHVINQIIEFNNTTHGYNYQKIFSFEEFYNFFDFHTLLYKFQLVLLTIIELMPIMATHFYNRET